MPIVLTHKATVRQNRVTGRWKVGCTCGLRITLNAHWLALRIAAEHRHAEFRHSAHEETENPDGCPSCGACACFIGAHDFTHGTRFACDNCKRWLREEVDA